MEFILYTLRSSLHGEFELNYVICLSLKKNKETEAVILFPTRFINYHL